MPCAFKMIPRVSQMPRSIDGSHENKHLPLRVACVKLEAALVLKPHRHAPQTWLLPLVQVCAPSLFHGSAIAHSFAQLNRSASDPDWHRSFTTYPHIYDSCSSSSSTFSTFLSPLPRPFISSTLTSDPSGSPCPSFCTIATKSTRQFLAAA